MLMSVVCLCVLKLFFWSTVKITSIVCIFASCIRRKFHIVRYLQLVVQLSSILFLFYLNNTSNLCQIYAKYISLHFFKSKSQLIDLFLISIQGAVIGISVGVIIAVLIIFGITCYCIRKKAPPDGENTLLSPKGEEVASEDLDDDTLNPMQRL